jgi:hypothetical protein
MVRRVLREQFVIQHRRLLAIVRDDEVCRRLMTVPGVATSGLVAAYADACNRQMVFADKSDTTNLAIEYIYINGFANVRDQCPAERHFAPATGA